MPNERPGFFGRAAGAVRDSAMQTGRGIRRSVPGTRDFNWRQAVDFISEPFVPGNYYNSDTGRLQAPGAGLVRGVRDLFTRDPADPNGQPPQAEQPNRSVGDWFRDMFPMPGRNPQPTPGQPLQPGMPPLANVPSEPMPPLPSLGPLPQYGYQDPNAVGPPAYMAGNTPMPNLSQPTQGRQGQAGRFGQTFLSGPSAVEWARSQAPTGLGASSYGRDWLHRQNRMG